VITVVTVTVDALNVDLALSHDALIDGYAEKCKEFCRPLFLAYAIFVVKVLMNYFSTNIYISCFNCFGPKYSS
jgi:hypothetical protein